MRTRHRHTIDQYQLRQFRLNEKALLGTLAALLASIFICTSTSDADLYNPFVGALGMGAVICMTIQLTARRNLRQ
jgi:hypothetical protein